MKLIEIRYNEDHHGTFKIYRQNDEAGCAFKTLNIKKAKKMVKKWFKEETEKTK